MDDSKRKRCPDCRREMEPGFLQISEYAAFNKQRQIFSLRPDEEGEVQLTGDGFFSDHRGNFHGWICRECGLILFDYTNNRAGMGRPVLDVLAEKMDAFFESIDRRFDAPDSEPSEAEETAEAERTPDDTAAGKTERRIITASGVQIAEDEETR